MATYTTRNVRRADLTVSSKRQITIPAAMARELHIKAGDKLVARLEDGGIVLEPAPKDWLEYVSGSARGLYGRTKEEIDAYIREVRGGWETDAQIADRNSYLAEDDLTPDS